MKEYQRLGHTKWDYEYRVVYLPKFRKKLLYGHLRRELVAILRELAGQEEQGQRRGYTRYVSALCYAP